jgi:hypothetical protein
VTARVAADRTSVRLSESVRATLTVEGPAPLRVEPPKAPLDPVSDRDWKVQPVGPPAVSAAAGGRQTWAQAFRLDPYVPGEKLPVVFAAVRVNGREVAPGGFEVTVVSTVAKTDPPRPATGIEELPPPPIDTPVSPSPWWAAGAVAVVALAAVVAWRLRRKPAPVPPELWAAAEFDEVERADLAPAARVERAAAVLREFVARRLGVPAPTLTTAELLAAVGQAGRPAGEVEALRAVLDRCDRSKYAGDVPADGGREVVAECRRWVEVVGPAAGQPPP